jgi:hypothetical protein
MKLKVLLKEKKALNEEPNPDLAKLRTFISQLARGDAEKNIIASFEANRDNLPKFFKALEKIIANLNRDAKAHVKIFPFLEPILKTLEEFTIVGGREAGEIEHAGAMVATATGAAAGDEKKVADKEKDEKEDLKDPNSLKNLSIGKINVALNQLRNKGLSADQITKRINDIASAISKNAGPQRNNFINKDLPVINQIKNEIVKLLKGDFSNLVKESNNLTDNLIYGYPAAHKFLEILNNEFGSELFCFEEAKADSLSKEEERMLRYMRKSKSDDATDYLATPLDLSHIINLYQKNRPAVLLKNYIANIQKSMIELNKQKIDPVDIFINQKRVVLALRSIYQIIHLTEKINAAFRNMNHIASGSQGIEMINQLKADPGSDVLEKTFENTFKDLRITPLMHQSRKKFDHLFLSILFKASDIATGGEHAAAAQQAKKTASWGRSQIKETLKEKESKDPVSLKGLNTGKVNVALNQLRNKGVSADQIIKQISDIVDDISKNAGPQRSNFINKDLPVISKIKDEIIKILKGDFSNLVKESSNLVYIHPITYDLLRNLSIKFKNNIDYNISKLEENKLNNNKYNLIISQINTLVKYYSKKDKKKLSNFNESKHLRVNSKLSPEAIQLILKSSRQNGQIKLVKEECSIKNHSNKDMSQLERILTQFYPYAKEKLKFEEPVNINLVSDEENSKDPFGKTAYYNPETMEITIFVDNRHPKDMLRSVSHELVHHSQNCKGEFGDLDSTEPGYAQEDPHLRNMEGEAYLLGSGFLVRDFEDMLKKLKEN